MYLNISPSNIIFILAYAFDLKWEYLVKEISETDLQESSFFELLVFVLVKWTNKLRRQGLFRSFLEIENEIKRIRGKILFKPSIKSNGLSGNTLCCQFDELSFDILENQILLSTLEFCEKELVKRKRNVKEKKKKDDLDDLALSAYNLVRLLSSQVSYRPLGIQLFNQLFFHRMNIAYKPILRICRFIYDAAVLAQEGEEKFFDIPENKISEIFERFLRNYLAEKLRYKGYRINEKSFESNTWLNREDQSNIKHMPAIHPDIIIWEKGNPKFVIDAKFYEKPLYMANLYRQNDNSEKENNVYKIRSHNLYQIMAYSQFLNCNGLLVYAQTQMGAFEEMVYLNSKYYDEDEKQESEKRRFGFCTLDLSGDFEEFKGRMDGFVQKVIELIKIN